MTFKEVFELSGMTSVEFSNHFHIPYRTVMHWLSGTRNCPPYLVELIAYKIKKEAGGV